MPGTVPGAGERSLNRYGSHSSRSYVENTKPEGKYYGIAILRELFCLIVPEAQRHHRVHTAGSNYPWVTRLHFLMEANMPPIANGQFCKLFLKGHRKLEALKEWEMLVYLLLVHPVLDLVTHL